MNKANNYRRKMHKDSPSRWFSFICLCPSGTEEFHGYLKITTNLNDAEIRIWQGNQTFQIKDIISICLRLKIFLLKWIEVNNIDRSLLRLIPTTGKNKNLFIYILINKLIVYIIIIIIVMQSEEHWPSYRPPTSPLLTMLQF